MEETSSPSIIDSYQTIHQWYRRETMIRIPQKYEQLRQELESMYLSISHKLRTLSIHEDTTHPDIVKFKESYDFFQKTIQEEMNQELKMTRETFYELLSEKQKLQFEMKRKKVHSFFGSHRKLSFLYKE
jgi:hypothetical protein